MLYSHNLFMMAKGSQIFVPFLCYRYMHYKFPEERVIAWKYHVIVCTTQFCEKEGTKPLAILNLVYSAIKK
jgi:hypothetical protein